MAGVVKNIVAGASFHDFTGVHDNDIVRHIGHDAEVVGNHDDGHAQALLQVFHQLQNLGLNRHIQGGGGFVGDQ